MAFLIQTPYEQSLALQKQEQANAAVWNAGQADAVSAAQAQTAQLNAQGAQRLTALYSQYGQNAQPYLQQWQTIANNWGVTLNDFADSAQEWLSQPDNTATNRAWWGSDLWARVPVSEYNSTLAANNPAYNPSTGQINGTTWHNYYDAGAEAAQGKQISDTLMAQQNANHSSNGWLGAVIAVVGVAAAVFTAGASLAAVGAAEAGAGAAVAGGVGDAALAGAALGGGGALDAGAVAATAGGFDASAIGAASISGAEIGGAGALDASALAADAAGGASALDYAKAAYKTASAGNSVAKLINGQASTANPLTGVPGMASVNPLYGDVVANTGDAQNQQAAMPAQVGATPGGAAPALPFGLTSTQLAMFAAGGVVLWCFWGELKG